MDGAIAVVRRENANQSRSRMRAVLEDYCRQTSLHGWSFCFRVGRSRRHTAGWLVVIAASVAAMAFLVTVNVLEFREASVSFSLESPTVPLSEVYFPAVTLCNMNTMRRSFVHSLLKDPALAPVGYNALHDIIERTFVLGHKKGPDKEESAIISKIFASKVYESLFDEFSGAAYSNESAIDTDLYIFRWHFFSLNNLTAETREQLKRSAIGELAVQFRDDEVIAWASVPGYGIAHVPGINTDFSDTCHNIVTFYKKPTDIYYYSTMEKSVSNGVNNGLQLLLDTEAYDYGSTQSGDEGFTVGISHHLDGPVMKQAGVRIRPGQSVEMALTPALAHITSAARRRFAPKARQCYLEGELKLRHFPWDLSYRYSMSNCLYEATVQKIEQTCNCTPSNFLGLANGFSSCSGDAKRCQNRLIDSIGSEKHVLHDAGAGAAECLSACEDQTNAILLTQAAFPSIQYFHRHPDFCVVINKLVRSCRGDRRESLDLYNADLCALLDGVDASHIKRSRCKDLTVYSGNETVRAIQRHVTRYARDNMVRLNVYVRDPYVKRYLTEEKITEIQFVGVVGGVMGLLTGFSFISIVEILYYLLFYRALGERRIEDSQTNSDTVFVMKRRRNRVSRVSTDHTYK